jgi:hypothetical protein
MLLYYKVRLCLYTELLTYTEGSVLDVTKRYKYVCMFTNLTARQRCEFIYWGTNALW